MHQKEGCCLKAFGRHGATAVEAVACGIVRGKAFSQRNQLMKSVSQLFCIV